MYNPSHNISSKNPKKSSYLYLIFGISFLAVVILSAIFLFSNTDSAVPIIEKKSIKDEILKSEPKPNLVQKINSTDIESLQKLSEYELIYYGDDFTHNRFYDESVILYKIALEKNENNIRALNGLGYSLSQLHSSDEAIKQHAKVLDMEPSNINAINGMGIAYTDLEMYDDALSYFQKSLNLNQNNVNAYNGLGFVYTNLGYYTQAIENFQKSLLLDPFRAETHNGMAFSYFQSGQFNESVESYRKALEINPNNLDALLGMALVFSETGQNDETAKLIDTARNVSATIDSQIINKIILQGNKLADDGEYEKAIVLYDRVLKLYDHVNALNGKAIALMNLKQYDKALLLLDRALQVDPSNTNAQNIQKLIQERQN